MLKNYKNVRGEIRTHAHISGLQPECSALDHSATLTHTLTIEPKMSYVIYTQ